MARGNVAQITSSIPHSSLLSFFRRCVSIHCNRANSVWLVLDPMVKNRADDSFSLSIHPFFSSPPYLHLPTTTSSSSLSHPTDHLRSLVNHQISKPSVRSGIDQSQIDPISSLNLFFPNRRRSIGILHLDPTRLVGKHSSSTSGPSSQPLHRISDPLHQLELAFHFKSTTAAEPR